MNVQIKEITSDTTLRDRKLSVPPSTHRESMGGSALEGAGGNDTRSTGFVGINEGQMYVVTRLLLKGFELNYY